MADEPIVYPRKRTEPDYPRDFLQRLADYNGNDFSLGLMADVKTALDRQAEKAGKTLSEYWESVADKVQWMRNTIELDCYNQKAMRLNKTKAGIEKIVNEIMILWKSVSSYPKVQSFEIMPVADNFEICFRFKSGQQKAVQKFMDRLGLKNRDYAGGIEGRFFNIYFSHSTQKIFNLEDALVEMLGDAVRLPSDRIYSGGSTRFTSAIRDILRCNRKDDKFFTDLETNTTVGQVQGRRDNQQDAFAFHSLPREFSEFAHEVQETVLRESVALMHDLTTLHCDEEVLRLSGTTAVTACAWLNEDSIEAICAHLGDSPAYVIIVNPATKEVTTHPLTKILHRPSQPEERTRIEEEGTYEIKDGRLLVGRYDDSGGYISGSLECSRVIGDQAYLRCDSNKLPDVNRVLVPLCPGEIAFLVTHSDGLTEGSDPTKTVADNFAPFASVFAMRHDDPEEAMIQMLRIALLNSCDNGTVTITRVTKRPVYVGVFDGHGQNGHILSAAVSKAFYPQLAQCVQTAIHYSRLVPAAAPIPTGVSSGPNVFSEMRGGDRLGPAITGAPDSVTRGTSSVGGMG